MGLTLLIVSSLNGVERYLLLAGYISAHNNAKHDLKLFSSAGKKARVVRNQGAKKKTIHRDKVVVARTAESLDLGRSI